MYITRGIFKVYVQIDLYKQFAVNLFACTYRGN